MNPLMIMILALIPLTGGILLLAFNHLTILVPILLPIIGGIALLLRHHLNEHMRRIYLEVIACVTTLFVWIILLTGGTGMVTLYRFTRGFAIDFACDGLSAVFAGMVSVMWPLVLLYAFVYMEGEKWTNSFYAFYIMTYGITLAIAFSASLLTLYVFFEMLTLVTIPLVAHYRNHESMYAARSYAAYVIGGAALAFVSVVLVALSGNEGIFAYGGSLSEGYSRQLMQIAYLFGFFGFGVKAAVFPLHAWLPRASVAPTPVTALLHAVAVVNSGVFGVMRLTYYSIPAEVVAGTWIHGTVQLFSAFTIVFAAMMALRERHFKRRLAYSTVSNLSYMLFGITLLTPEGFAGGLSHMLFHGIIKMTLFLCAGAFMHVTGKEYVYEVNGVGKRMPLVFTMYTLAALSLIGIPLFSGFISKWLLVSAGVKSASAWAYIGVGALILSAFLCAMYTLTVTIRAFIPPAEKDFYAGREEIRDPEWMMLAPILVFSVLNIVFGIWSGPILGLIRQIASGLW